MGQAHLRLAHPFDAGVHQLEIGAVGEAELVEALRLGAGDIARGRAAGGVGVLVMRNERSPVLVAGALDGGTDLLAGERRGT